jgi:hypothetical protein
MLTLKWQSFTLPQSFNFSSDATVLDVGSGRANSFRKPQDDSRLRSNLTSLCCGTVRLAACLRFVDARNKYRCQLILSTAPSAKSFYALRKKIRQLKK